MLLQNKIFLDLNINQQEAVNHTEGPILILAGAGTGKTKVLITKIAYLILNNIATPDQILAVTFTNKAAQEMLSRINSIISADGLNIGTFHAIATKMLRHNIDLLNIERLSSNFSIINQDDQIKTIKSVINNNNIDSKLYTPKLIYSIISKWKDQGLFSNQIKEYDLKFLKQKIAHLVYTEYQKKIQLSNNVDFGDLLMYCNQLLINNPQILDYYHNKIRYIFIDEYQDTNISQYIWARILASKYKNICCVGDDDQSIYSWRGAEIQNILRFSHDFTNAKIVKLEQNYRSSSYILEVAYNIIKHNKDRHEKKLWTEYNTGEKIKIISCWSDKEEAYFITSEIKKYISLKKYKASDAAILIRASFQTRAFEEVFINNAIPYKIIGGTRFYERAEIKDILSYIRLSTNNNDNIALERIINVPKRNIGPITINKIKDYSYNHNISLFDSINELINQGFFTEKVKNKLIQFVELINITTGNLHKDSAYNVTKEILNKSGYLDVLKNEKTEESKNKLENINEMLRAISDFNNIKDFIEHASLVTDNTSTQVDFGGVITIMTLHAAKGLEFPLVFLPGWEENLFPHQKSLTMEGEKGLEEERRLAYVGITRAKHDLYITYAENRKIFTEINQTLPSRFLSEIPNELCIRKSSISKINYSKNSPKYSYNQQINNQDLNLDQMILKKKQPGDKVKHSKFGYGIILKKQGSNLEILFENNILKTIKEDYITAI